MYVPPCVCTSNYLSLDVYVSSVCMSSPCHVYVLPCVCPLRVMYRSLRVYIPSVSCVCPLACVFFRMYVSRCVFPFDCISSRCVCPLRVMRMSLLYVPPCVLVHFSESIDQRCVFHRSPAYLDGTCWSSGHNAISKQKINDT